MEREKSKRRVHGGKGAGGEIVRDFLTKLYSNYFRAVKERKKKESQPSLGEVYCEHEKAEAFFGHSLPQNQNTLPPR